MCSCASGTPNCPWNLIVGPCIRRWTLDNVRAALLRWRATRDGSSPAPPLAINRRQFFEIFTDYSVIAEGAFLCRE